MRLRFRETDREGGSVTEPDRERDTRLSHRHIKAREFETGTQRERARGKGRGRDYGQVEEGEMAPERQTP